MTRAALIIDCDPGVDDAVALFLAFASPDAFDILAVTTVGGNVDAMSTARNARIVRQMAGREEVPVFVGAAAPLVRPPIAASHFHGESGLGSLPIFEPAAPAAPGDAASAIVEMVMSRAPGSVSLAVTGPMTNLALALRMQPAVARRLGPVVAMGGARSEGGNITASAEYNIHADPHAADIVFRSGCRPTVLGLDATHQVRATPERVAAIAGIDTVPGRAVASLLEFCARTQEALVGWDSPPLHDPCTIAWLLAPQLFEAAPVQLRVETDSPLTMGHTAVEFRLPDPAKATAQWVTKANGDGVFALLADRLARR
ncbi:MAG: nucleoside hydrolase [Caulobacteraceae bacterium]|nr:nucleoside hydrolase [Caulobacteraceae bacterium]